MRKLIIIIVACLLCSVLALAAFTMYKTLSTPDETDSIVDNISLSVGNGLETTLDEEAEYNAWLKNVKEEYDKWTNHEMSLDTYIKYKEIYKDEKNISEYQLTDEQKQIIIDFEEKENKDYQKYPYERHVLLGDVANGENRLDLDKAKEIISQNDAFYDILVDFLDIQKYPDTVGGSGVTLIYFNLNGANPRILIIYEQQQIILITYDENEAIVEREQLY